MTESESTGVARAGDVAAGQRVAMRVAYRGTNFSGWQRQPNAVTVQECVEGALSRLLQHPTKVIGASRTDTGVHALAQWFHFELPRPFPLKGLVLGANTLLPDDVRLLGARQVVPTFHAQHCALFKRYEYRLSRVRVSDPLRAPMVATFATGVNYRLVSDAIGLFEGRHNFQAFAKAGGSHDDPVREIYQAQVAEVPGELVFTFCGNGFLRGMVRAMVGTLVEVGVGRRCGRSIAELFQPGLSRSDSGVAAPAQGLVLAHIDYPDELFAQARFDADAQSPSST